MNVHDSARSPKLVIRTSIVDCLDAILPQSRSTHHTWLDRNIEDSLMQYAHWVRSEDLLNRNKLGMSCAIE